jgi:hypothetical protein
LAITDEWLPALITSEVERVFEHFSGGAGEDGGGASGDGVEQPTGAAGMMTGDGSSWYIDRMSWYGSNLRL